MWGLVTLSRATAALAFTTTSSSTRSQLRRSLHTTSPLFATQYLLRYDYVPDILEQRGPHREGHLGLAQQMCDEGTCLAGGPVGPVPTKVPTGALFVFANEAAAQLFCDQDPYVKAGLVTQWSIEEWNVVIEKK